MLQGGGGSPAGKRQVDGRNDCRRRYSGAAGLSTCQQRVCAHSMGVRGGAAQEGAMGKPGTRGASSCHLTLPHSLPPALQPSPVPCAHSPRTWVGSWLQSPRRRISCRCGEGEGQGSGAALVPICTKCPGGRLLKVTPTPGQAKSRGTPWPGWLAGGALTWAGPAGTSGLGMA